MRPKKPIRKADLISLLMTLKDYRRKQGVRHPLHVILLIIIMGIMSGAKGERAIARFARNNKKALVQALNIKRGEVPTRCIIQRTIQRLDFAALQKIFSGWALQLAPVKPKDIISLDGKAINGTVRNGQNSFQSFVSLVSVFASQRRQVLAAAKIASQKESEIPAVRELVKMLDLPDVTFTLDALHCQRETLKTIKQTGSHYLAGVKGNQHKLYEDIKKGAEGR